MALVVHFDRVLMTGRFQSQADSARASRVTRGRLTQILNLTGLAPNVQMKLHFLGSAWRRYIPSFYTPLDPSKPRLPS